MERRDQVMRFRCTKEERELIEKAAFAEFTDSRQVSSYLRKLVLHDIMKKIKDGEISP